MKEIIPEGDDKILDVVYDEVEYHITAIVWDMNGQLAARVTELANGINEATIIERKDVNASTVSFNKTVTCSLHTVNFLSYIF